MCSWRQRLGRCFHKPRNAKDCQRTVGNERRDMEQTPFTDSEGTNPTDPRPWTPHLQICETTKRCSSRSGVPRYSSSGKLIHSPWAGAIHLIMNALRWGFFFPWDSHLLLLAPAHPPSPPPPSFHSSALKTFYIKKHFTLISQLHILAPPKLEYCECGEPTDSHLCLVLFSTLGSLQRAASLLPELWEELISFHGRGPHVQTQLLY